MWCYRRAVVPGRSHDEYIQLKQSSRTCLIRLYFTEKKVSQVSEAKKKLTKKVSHVLTQHQKSWWQKDQWLFSLVMEWINK